MTININSEGYNKHYIVSTKYRDMIPYHDKMATDRGRNKSNFTCLKFENGTYYK